MRRTLLCCGLALAATALPVTEVHAQRWFNPPSSGVWGGTGVWPGAAYGAAYGAYLGGGIGASPGAQYLSGVSHIIRAQGEYNESTSRAYINYEEARKNYISNRKQWQQAYFAMREANDARRLAKLENAKHTPEALAEASRSAVPRPLSHDAYDPVTGRIQWPTLLQRDEFALPRQRIEQLLEVRAATDGADTDIAGIRLAAEEMTEILRSKIEDIPVDEYISARKFLDSVAWTIRAA